MLKTNFRSQSFWSEQHILETERWWIVSNSLDRLLTLIQHVVVVVVLVVSSGMASNPLMRLQTTKRTATKTMTDGHNLFHFLMFCSFVKNHSYQIAINHSPSVIHRHLWMESQESQKQYTTNNERMDQMQNANQWTARLFAIVMCVPCDCCNAVSIIVIRFVRTTTQSNTTTTSTEHPSSVCCCCSGKEFIFGTRTDQWQWFLSLCRRTEEHFRRKWFCMHPGGSSPGQHMYESSNIDNTLENDNHRLFVNVL
jgi:hypothetical protein